MSGHIPDLEDIGARDDEDACDDRQTNRGMGARAPSERPVSAIPISEQQLSASIVYLDLRMRHLEREETKGQIEQVRTEVYGLREMIVRVDNEKEARHKSELNAVLDEVRARTWGPKAKGAVIIGIAALVFLFAGLGTFVFRAAVALEQIQGHQEQRLQRLQKQQDEEK